MYSEAIRKYNIRLNNNFKKKRLYTSRREMKTKSVFPKRSWDFGPHIDFTCIYFYNLISGSSRVQEFPYLT